MEVNNPKPYKKKPFAGFCWNKYFENRDEYHSFGQVQPHSFREYVKENISFLKEKYRLTRR
jgi:hypothetical protein